MLFQHAEKLFKDLKADFNSWKEFINISKVVNEEQHLLAD